MQRDAESTLRGVDGEPAGKKERDNVDVGPGVKGEFGGEKAAGPSEGNRKEELISQVFTDGQAGGEIFLGFAGDVFSNGFGGEPAFAEAGEEFGDVVEGEFKQENVAGAERANVVDMEGFWRPVEFITDHLQFALGDRGGEPGDK